MADDPSTDRPDRSPEWWQPPQDHAPAVLPITEVVASTPTVAIALVGAHIYPNGIELQLELRARRREEDDNEWHAVIDAFFARPGTPAGPRSELEATYAVSI